MKNPKLPLSSVIKIISSPFSAPRLFSEIRDFKVQFKAVNFFRFEEVFGKSKRESLSR